MNHGLRDNESLAAMQEDVSQSAPGESVEGGARPALADLLILRLGARWLALPASVVREVALKSYVTHIPMAPPNMLGVAVIRSRVVPVIQLEAALGTGSVTELVPTLPRLVVIETEDALEIHPQPLRAGAIIETYHDHRFAMSFGVLGCHDRQGDGQTGLTVRDPACCAKTFPHFFELLESLRQKTLAC